MIKLCKHNDGTGRCDMLGNGFCVERPCPKEEIVEYEPVRHGRWVWDNDGYCRCSNCTQKAPVMPQYQDEPITTMTRFCPYCGARMNGGTEDA